MGAKRKKKLQCDTCEKVFFSLQTLERHKSYHVNHRRGFKCDNCDMFFMSDTYLKKHRCSDVSKSGDQSDARDEDFTSQQTSASDTQTSHNHQIFKCGFCQSCFVSQKVLNLHMAMTPAKRHHKCTECRKRFHCAQQFHEHFLTHNSLLKACYVCGNVLNEDEAGLKRHLSSHAEIDELSCENCLKEFITEDDLEKHKKDCIQNNELISADVDTESDNVDMNDSMTSAKSDGDFFTDKDVLRHVHLDFRTSPGSKHVKEMVIKKEVVDVDTSPVPTRRSSRTSRPTAKKRTYEKSLKEDSGDKVLSGTHENDSTENISSHNSEVEYEDINQCKICSKKFKRRRYLKDHMKIHNKQEPHSCHICGLKIKYNPSNFRRHMKKHSNSREFSCNVCSMCFYRPDDLQVHMKTHYKYGRCVCTKCGIGFSTTEKLEKHTLSHDVNKDIPCEKCEKSFVSRIQYQDHCGREHGGQFPCDLCGKSLNSKYWLEKHKLEFHLSEMTASSLTDDDGDENDNSFDVKYAIESPSKRNDEKQTGITIPEVSDVSAIEESFQDVMQNESEINDVPNDSSELNDVRNDSSEFNYVPEDSSEGACNTADEQVMTSMASPDSDITPKREPMETFKDQSDCFKCEFCGKLFAKRGNLRRHKNENCGKTHFSEISLNVRKSKDERKEDKKPAKKDHQCPQCPKRFSRRCDLSLHTRVHAGVKNYVCEICSASYFSLSNLNRHKEIHEGRSNNVCHVCGKAFACRNYLFTHIKRIHETDNSKTDKFQCEKCPRTFTSYSNYKRHLRIHTGERPHTCDICHKAFRRTDDLAMHMKTHSSDKPHKCELCNKSFNQRHNLKKHLQRHDQVLKPIYRCPECNKSFRQKKAFIRHLTSHNNITEYLDQNLQTVYVEPTDIVLDKEASEIVKPDHTQHSRTADAIAAAISSIQRQDQGLQVSEETGQSEQNDREVIIVLPSDTVAPFQCNLCNSDFPEIGQLVAHMIEHD